MISNVLSIFLALTSAGSTARQAKALLSLVKPDSLFYHETRLGLDYSGKLWLVDNYKGKIHVSRIQQGGKIKPEKVSVFEVSVAQIGTQLIFDDLNSLYFTVAGGEGVNEKTPLELFQVTGSGKVLTNIYWPMIPFKRNYLERLEGDTLLIIGGAVFGEVFVSKGILGPDSIIPAFDTSYIMEEMSMLNIGTQTDYSRTIHDWRKGWGLRADIQWYQTHPEVGPDKLILTKLNLGKDGDFSVQTLGIYPWRDYVWRTYPGAWMRHLTITPYETGGFVVAVSDPKDHSIGYLIRLDTEGYPVTPNTLEGSGTFSALAFDKLPSSATRNVALSMWGRIEQGPDSAQVVYWGLDNTGNLYSYRRLQVYPRSNGSD